MFCKARTRRWRLVLASLAILLSWPCSKVAAEQTRRTPNILFILLDNVGKDWFRCYGSQENQTPNIDRLAATGLKFRNFYVTPVCSTTRTMLLTGRYPFRTGWHTHHDSAIYGGGYLDWKAEITFGRLLRDAGYATCISGKWQINDLFDPAQQDALARHGFQEHLIWPEAPPGHPAHKKRYWDAWILRDGQRIDTAGRFGPDVFTDYTIDFMKRHRDRPFLVYHSAILTHIPVTTTPLNRDQAASPRQKFSDMLRYADHLVGRMVAALDELGLRNDTIVFVAVDNGTDNGTDQGMEHSLGGRIGGRVSREGIYSLTERGINVPLIANCPGRIPAGRESDALINAADILPTLVALSGAKLPEGVPIDGESFAEVLRQGTDDSWKRPWTFTQYHDTRVIRDQRFKLYSTGPFHDLAEDPLELHDMARSAPPLPEQAAAARERLQAVLDSLPANAEWPFVFRSISARKFRAAADADRRAAWVAQDHRPPDDLRQAFQVPVAFQDDTGPYRSPLVFADGRKVETADQWRRRREEILSAWQEMMGPWPPLIEKPRVEAGTITRRQNVTQRRVRVEIGLGGEMVDGFLLVPDGDGPFPAVLVPYYDAQTGAALGTPLRDFGWQLARRGFVTLSIGKPNTGVNLDDPQQIPARGAPYFGPLEEPVRVQPLSALAYAAANAHTLLAQRPEVYPNRIGIVGHSFGGKWALFASCLYDKFDCAVWSDPGVVFDERDRRKENPGGSVNYWDPWYLGFELGTIAEPAQRYRFGKLPSEGEPRSGSYQRLVEAGADLQELHALMAPRPFLVSGGTADLLERWSALRHAVAVNKLLGYENRVAMTNRPTHAPTEESNEQIYRFFERRLKKWGPFPTCLSFPGIWHVGNVPHVFVNGLLGAGAVGRTAPRKSRRLAPCRSRPIETQQTEHGMFRKTILAAVVFVACGNTFAADEAASCPLVYINTAFENASPLFWEIGDAGEINVFLMYDHERSSPNRAAGHWHFRVEAPKGSALTIVLNNLQNIYNGRKGSPASDRTISYISPDGSDWRATEMELLDGDRLKLTLQMEADQMYVARLEPYRLSDLEKLLDEIRDNPLVAITKIGETVQRRNLEVIRIGSQDAPHRVLIRARAHPWEPGGNWVVQGMIRRLLKDDVKARAYLERYSVYIMPMANKDGVARGWTRFNAAGKDLNRNWDQPADSVHAPENQALETWIESMIAQGRKPDLMIDFHNDQGGRLHISRPNVDLKRYLARMKRFESLLREHTWFTEGATGGDYRNPGTIGEGLLERYGIHACVHELNANRIAGLDAYPGSKNWELYGQQLCEVFYQLFRDE